MIDPRSNVALPTYWEPTPDVLHREEYLHHRKSKVASVKKVERNVIDLRLLRAEFLSKAGRFIRFA